MEESVRSIRKAISTNHLLGTLAVSDAVGNLMLNAERYASNILSGNEEAKRGEYLAFLEEATPEQKAEVAKALNLEDLDSTDFETFTDARIKYLYSEEGRKAVSSVTKTRKAAEAVPANEKAAPKLVSTALADGVHRYGGDNGIAIIKDGDSIRLYDYASRNPSRKMSIAETNKELQALRRAAEDRAEAKTK